VGKTCDHPFRDRSGRFETDALLRRYGFTIHSRRNGAEPVWSLGGELYAEAEALSRLDDDELWEAEYVTKLYYEGFE
jgi:hypothetical protein